MADYIERKAALSGLDELEKTSYHNSVLWPDHVEECREALRSIPAADVRPVVTCGECEFWNRERISCEGLARCNTGEGGIRYRNRNDFCSRGEKREES